MPVGRFYCDVKFEEGKEFFITGQEYIHLEKVTRKAVGETVEVVNGKGDLVEAEICSFSKKGGSLVVKNKFHKEKPSKKVILAQAIPKLNRLDTIVEKITELGVDEIWLFKGDKSDKKELSKNQIDRVIYQSISAMKQCGRLYLPKIEVKDSISSCFLESMMTFYGDFGDNLKPLKNVYPTNESFVIFIGPESGFSEREKDILIKNDSIGVTLHENILRTDTAAIVAVFSVMA